MAVPWSLLLAARCMVSGASRLKYNPMLTGPMTHSPTMVHAQLNPPQLQMLEPKNSDAHEEYDPPKFFSWSMRRFERPCGVVVPASTWTVNTRSFLDSSPGMSYQTFPLTVIHGMNARQLLKNWADSFVDPFAAQSPMGRLSWADSVANTMNASDSKHDGAPLLPKMPKYWQDDKAAVIHKMRDVVADALGNLEMVGLIPKDLEMPFLESGSSAADASVLALGIFSRKQLVDDSRGSICKVLEDRYGKEWAGLQKGRATKQFDDFEIEGLADAPGLPELSARVLLSKIQEYAHQEQKIVVVSKRAKRAYMGTDGKDVIDYYVRLGFEEVLMEDGTSELVYTGASRSAEDCWVENQQIMVGVSHGTGV